MNYKKTIAGSTIAFIIASSCCWLPAVIIAIGGGSALLGISNGIESFSGVFIFIGIGLLAFGIYQYLKQRNSIKSPDVILNSVITCPECGHKKEETMPTDSCQFLYQCEQCKKMLKPKEGDCCVYCSYGSVACPPIQLEKECC